MRVAQLQVRARSAGVLLQRLPGRHQRRAVDRRLQPALGTGTVFGVIGGYEEGGDYPWASYSVYFTGPTLKLYWQAEAQQF